MIDSRVRIISSGRGGEELCDGTLLIEFYRFFGWKKRPSGGVRKIKIGIAHIFSGHEKTLARDFLGI